MGDTRFVVDDAMLRVDDLPIDEVDAALHRLSEQLELCRRQGEGTGIISHFGQVECAPGQKLFELLTSPTVNHDVRLRAFGLLDKCKRIDGDPGFYLDAEVEVNGLHVVSYALAFVTLEQRHGRAVGALALVATVGPGAVSVKDDVGQATVHVIVDNQTRRLFYRSIYAIEDVPEAAFFDLGALAFPDLCFAADLSFGKFVGIYRDLRPIVVEHLGAINDRFHHAYAANNGLSGPVAAEVGIDLSIEGKARSSATLMASRNVTFMGSTFACEWHSKIAPDRNRIHFHPGGPATNGLVLIGLFVEHLRT